MARSDGTIAQAHLKLGFPGRLLRVRQKAPLTLAPPGFQGTSRHSLCTEGPPTPTLTADNVERTPKGLASWPAKSPASQKFSLSENRSVTAPETYREPRGSVGKGAAGSPRSHCALRLLHFYRGLLSHWEG